MQVSVEKTSELSRKMTVSIPAATVQEKMDARFKSLAREVKVDGFRPGKVPVSMVKKLFGERVKGEVTGNLIESSYFEALREHQLVPAGHPHIQPTDKEDGFEFIAEFEVYPEISLAGIDGLEITRPIADVADNDIDAMVKKLRQQKQTWEVVERAAQEGDRVTINFSGEAEGENFTDGKAEDFQVEIGGKRMIPGFEDELKGLKAGDAKTFNITFPEQYNEKLAGKQAEFSVEMTKVEEARLPELDADFIKTYGVEEGTVDAFLVDVKANMERQLQQGLKNKLKNAVLEALAEKIEVSVPKSLIDQEISELMKPYIEQAKRQKGKVEEMELPRDMFESQARRRVALGLILSEVISQNSIQVDSGKVREAIENMAQNYERSADVVNWYYADKSRLKDVEQMVLEEQTVEWVVGRAKITDQVVAFDDVMNS